MEFDDIIVNDGRLNDVFVDKYGNQTINIWYNENDPHILEELISMMKKMLPCYLILLYMTLVMMEFQETVSFKIVLEIINLLLGKEIIH